MLHLLNINLKSCGSLQNMSMWIDCASVTELFALIMTKNFSQHFLSSNPISNASRLGQAAAIPPLWLTLYFLKRRLPQTVERLPGKVGQNLLPVVRYKAWKLSKSFKCCVNFGNLSFWREGWMNRWGVDQSVPVQVYGGYPNLNETYPELFSNSNIAWFSTFLYPQCSLQNLQQYCSPRWGPLAVLTRRMRLSQVVRGTVWVDGQCLIINW